MASVMARGQGEEHYTREQWLSLRVRLSGLLATGHTLDDAQEALDISQEVARDLFAAIRREWQRRAVDDFTVIVGQELAKLDRIERELWTEYEKTKRTLVVNQDGETQIIEQPGDIAYMIALIRLHKERAQRLGLYPGKGAPVLPGAADQDGDTADDSRRPVIQLQAAGYADSIRAIENIIGGLPDPDADE